VDVRVVVEVVLSVVWARMRERKERSEKRVSVGRCIFSWRLSIGWVDGYGIDEIDRCARDGYNAMR